MKKPVWVEVCVGLIVGLTVGMFIIGCSDPPPDDRPRVTVQSSMIVDDNTSARVLVLPSGERVLLVRMWFTGAEGKNNFTISTTLLPQLTVEPKQGSP